MLFKRSLVLSVLLICVLTALSFAYSPWTGKVVGVSDGDTITVMHNGQGERVRLWGVDCPEKSQDFGQRAKQFTSGMVFGKVVKIEPHDIDRYGRTVGEVYIDGKCLNEELVVSGFAWVYIQYCKEAKCNRWISFEQKAMLSKTGLWSMPNQMAPWDFRHSGRSGNNSSHQYHQDAAASGIYHGNIESRKFHSPGCRYYDCRKCSVKFKNRQAAIEAGYTPCKVCAP